MGARPEEKAQAMLNKWVKMKEDSDPTNIARARARSRGKRPFIATQCEHLSDAEHFRRQIVREVTDMVKKIQNAGLGEHAIRDLNDGINKLLREKWHWNRRIKELGGRDWNKEERKAQLLAEKEGGGVEGITAPASQDSDPYLVSSGAGLKGSGGYRYFGAARELPGVKELFARQAARQVKRKRGDVYKYITPDYYGLRDDEDGVLKELESKMAEERRRKLKQCREEYQRAKGESSNDKGMADFNVDEDLDIWAGGIDSHVAVPSQEMVARILLQKKKEALLNRFG